MSWEESGSIECLCDNEIICKGLWDWVFWFRGSIEMKFYSPILQWAVVMALKYFPSLLDLIRLTIGPIFQCSLLAFSKVDYWTYEIHACLASHIFKGGWGGVRSFYYPCYFIIRVTLLDLFVKGDLRSFYKGDLDSAWDSKIAMTNFGDTFETWASLPWTTNKKIS